MRDDQTAGSSPLDDDDLLREVLLRVPPNPSSLPRASLVCKRWRRLVSDPRFLRRFREHHRRAPLLGFFRHRLILYGSKQGLSGNHILFHPILEPPDRVPPRRFSLGRALAGAGRRIELLACRHGRVVFLDTSRVAFTVLVWDPVTGGHVRLPPVPPEFAGDEVVFNGTVLCAAGGEQGHVHGACHSSPFKVVALSTSANDRRPMACVYSSETAMWGDTIYHDRPCRSTGDFIEPGTTLITHALYCKIGTWSQEEEMDDDMAEPDGLLEFDLDRQSLTVMKGPPLNHDGYRQIIKTVNGGVGLATVSCRTSQLQVWHRDVNCHNVATWLLFKTVDLRNIFGLQKHERGPSARRDDIVGYDEDDGVMFVCADSTLFMLQLDSMQFTRHYERIEGRNFTTCHPFRSFYFY